jgi:hypothetical protein
MVLLTRNMVVAFMMPFIFYSLLIQLCHVCYLFNLNLKKKSLIPYCSLPNKHSSYHIFGTIGKPSMWKGVRYQVHTWANETCYISIITIKVAKVVKLFIKSCPIGCELHPSFDASSFWLLCAKSWNFIK